MKVLNFITLFFSLGFAITGFANNFPAYISQDTVISKGSFVIDKNVSIASGATLFINKGVDISLKNGATFLVYGGLVVSGKVDKPVVFSSGDLNNLGTGIKLMGKSPTQLVLKHTIFDNLQVPLNISGLWQRSSVTVEDCIFKNITTGEPGVIIENAFPSVEDEIPFSFSRNKFVDNYSNISIGFFESNNVMMSFKHNVVTRNFIFGYEENSSLVSVAPVSFKLTDEKMRFPVIFEGNSVFNNYAVSNSNMYVKLTELNMGFKGTAPTVKLKGNFFGSENTAETAKETIIAENTSISLINMLDNPAKETPTHVVDLEYHDKNVYNEDNEFIPWATRNFVDTFSVVFSKPLENASIKEALYSDIWGVLVTSDLSDADQQNSLTLGNGGQVLNAMCPWSMVDEDEKNVPRYYNLDIIGKDGREEVIYIGRIYLDIYLFENYKKFTFEHKLYTMAQYQEYFSMTNKEEIEAAKESPYMKEFTRLKKMVSVSSAVNYYELGDEIIEFKKKWKKTPNYRAKDYRELRRLLESRNGG